MVFQTRSALVISLLIGVAVITPLPQHNLAARAREAPVTSVSSAAVSETATVVLSPEDTTLNLDAQNHSGLPQVMTYTWPDYTVANAILMKFDLSALPAGAAIVDAALHLALLESDASADASYEISVHKVVGKNVVIARATGQTADGVTPWTPNSCCYGDIPLAQGDISPPYDVRGIDKAAGFKSWSVTAMVQEWLQQPETNAGLVLRSDPSKLRDRYRYFASMEHADPTLRPSLRVTYALADATPPTVVITSPSNDGAVQGLVRLAATVSDNTGVDAVRFLLNGTPLSGQLQAAPYTFDWDTTVLSDGRYTLTATARDWAQNTGVSSPIEVTVKNGILRLSPLDTTLNLNTTNYSAHSSLMTYTWPDYKVANAILMKFALPSLPPGSVIQEALLNVALLQSDSTADATYQIAAHKILGRNVAVPRATGYSFDGVSAWTPSACCYNGVPLAQADISAAYDRRAIDKTPGFKTWTVTAMVQEWLLNPAGNFGLLLNSDATRPRDRYRFFASMEHADPTRRPYLLVRYSTDTTIPVISGVAARSVTSSGATITWTTDELSDSQVEYGPTSAYGSMTAVDSTLVTSHRVTLSGMSELSTYYFRVRSRDSAGNLATSGGYNFRTLDGTAPSVSIAAPAAGARVSGTITVAATASDNVGVAGVQFKVDGANLDVEDSTAPYSVSWNTTSATNASHTLTAVARDAAGNLRTSAAVAVTVSNTMVSGSIASRYPGDVGIETDPNVVFVERFDEGTLNNLFARWTNISNGSTMAFSADVPAGSPIPTSLDIPWVGGGISNGGHLYKKLNVGIDDTLYVRYYVKFPTSGNYSHNGVWIGGYNPALDWPNPAAGTRPAGNDRFSAAAEQNSGTRRFDHYNYWMGMRQSLDGKYWGNILLNNPNVLGKAGEWMCVEHMVKLNNPVTASNGEHAIWLDGTKISHLGQGFPNGFWSGGNFTQDPAGSPFPGFRWRSDTTLKLNYIWLQNYAPYDPAGFRGNMYFAHLVAAKSYIGCLAPSTAPVPTPLPGPDPTPSTTGWPNEPSGMMPFNDHSWDTLVGNGWNFLRRSSTHNPLIVTDGSVPFSPSKALQMIYSAGCCSDAEPSVHWLGLPRVREIFTGWWFKLSPNWIPNPAGGGKITFLFTDVGGQVYTNLYHPSSDGSVQGAPYRVGANTEWAPYGQKIWLPNVATTWINPGEWHRVEFYYRWETTPGVSGDGIIRWWVDGQLNGDHRNVRYPAAQFQEFQFAPTVQYAGSADRYMYIDHSYVSVR